MGVGDVAASAGGSTGVTISFTGCPLTARFRANIGFSANAGADTGSRTLYQQFQ